jgi:hypothetical protein
MNLGLEIKHLGFEFWVQDLGLGVYGLGLGFRDTGFEFKFRSLGV